MNLNRFSIKTIISLIFAMTVLTSGQSQSTNLSLKLAKGERYQQTTNSKMTIVQELNGQKMTIVMKVNGTMSFYVKDIVESNYHMDAQFERLSMAMEMPQGSVEFNSEKNDVSDIFSTILGSIKNKSFEVNMSIGGKVIEVKNVEVLWNEAINQFDQLSEMQKEQIKTQLMKSYGAEALKGNIEMVTAIYPEHSVNKGDRWTIDTNLESGMSASVSTIYEFADLTSDYALIRGNSTIKTADKDAYIESNGMSMKYDLTGSMTSEIKVDKKSGWIIEAKVNQDIKGDANIKDNPQMPGGMKVPMAMISEMVITN